MTIILETERLRLRTWSLDDAEDAYRIWSDPEVMRYIKTGQPYAEIELMRGWLRRMIAHQKQHGFCFWAVVEKERGQLIGNCGMAYSLNGGPPVNFGYTLARSCWGRGYATEAARECLGYAFERLHLPELVAIVDSRNTASRRVLEKIGFIYQRTEKINKDVALWYMAKRSAQIQV
jgi:ribosomal-protein-alanine N-acetyltransferase